MVYSLFQVVREHRKQTGETEPHTQFSFPHMDVAKPEDAKPLAEELTEIMSQKKSGTAQSNISTDKM